MFSGSAMSVLDSVSPSVSLSRNCRDADKKFGPFVTSARRLAD